MDELKKYFDFVKDSHVQGSYCRFCLLANLLQDGFPELSSYLIELLEITGKEDVKLQCDLIASVVNRKENNL